MEYSNDMQDVYKNPGKKCKVLIVSDDMTADMTNNKKLKPIVTELLIRGRKLNISIVFITQSYLRVQKGLRIILQTRLLLKFQINDNFRKLLQITHQILTLKIL